MNKIPTIAVVLKPKLDKHKLQMILLRITFERKVIYKSVGIKTKASLFNPKAEAFKYISAEDGNSKQKNTIIRDEYETLEASFYDYAVNEPLTLAMVKLIVDNGVKHGLYINDLATEYLTSITNAGTRKKWKHCLELVDLYSPGGSITSINVAWLKGFEDYLTLKYGNTNSRLSPLKFIRAVINFAMARGVQMDYPFGKGKYMFPATIKFMRNYLTQKELVKLQYYIDHECKDAQLSQIGKWFVLQCYSGLRYSDIELWNSDMIRDDKIYFADKKTKTPHFIPIYPELQCAIDAVANLKPVAYEQYKRNVRMLGIAINLTFPLTSHIARHSFAVHYLERGGNVFFLQALLGHGDIRTTMIYAKITHAGLEADMKRTRG